MGDRETPAIELVGSEQEVSAAVKYAFGGAFVCKVRRVGGGVDVEALWDGMGGAGVLLGWCIWDCGALGRGSEEWLWRLALGSGFGDCVPMEVFRFAVSGGLHNALGSGLSGS